MSGGDDDALDWGDDDPTLQSRPPSAGAPSTLPVGYRAVGRGAERVADEPADTTLPAPEAVPGNVALVATGVVAGIYVLLAIGWVIGGLRLAAVAPLLVAPGGGDVPGWSGGNLVAVWLAVAAPALWFAVVMLGTRRSRPWLRWLLLATGALLLLPWPFIMVGASGA